MQARGPGFKILGYCLLLFSGQAAAHGGLGSLEGLYAAFMILLGLGGLVLVAFLIPAVRSGVRNDGAGNWTRFALFLGMVYAFFSLSFYFSGQDSGYSKFPGFVGAVVLVLLSVYFLRHRRRARNAVLTAIGVATVVLVLIPAGFWKGNPFDVVETVFVDNSADLADISWHGDRDSVRQLLVAKDGRKILQFEADSEAQGADELFGELPGDRVSLSVIDTGRTGEWYEIDHYVTDRRYIATSKQPWNKPRRSLFTREVNMYRPTGQRSIGVRLDAAAGIDFERLLLEILSRSGTRELKRTLIDAGGIKLERQSFIDVAFAHRYGEAYEFLVYEGLDVNATSSAGDSMLHRAADIASVRLMKLLVDRGADLQAENAEGQTAFELFLEEHGDRPIAMRPFRAAFPGVVVEQD